MSKMRMYFNILGTKPYFKEVSSLKEAKTIMDTMISFVSAKINEGIFPAHALYAGLVEYSEKEKDWMEWYKDGLDFYEYCQKNEDVPDINDENVYQCSCGYGWDKSKVFRHHFCPNCGKPVDSSTKPCEDCTSRKEVHRQINEWVASGDSEKDLLSLHKRIDTLPPVAPQPKIGQWILTPRDKYIDINCSVCGNTRIKDYSYGYSIDELNLDEANDFLSKARINYCEHCGAKMQGGVQRVPLKDTSKDDWTVRWME